MTNKVIVNVDKLKGSIKTSAKNADVTYLDGGTIHMGKNNMRVSWMRPNADMLNKGGLVFANVEVSKPGDKVFTQLTIEDMLPVLTEDNNAYLTGEVVEVKTFTKLVSAQLKISHTNWKKETLTANVTVKSLDKESAIGKALADAKGKGEVFIKAKLDPSNTGWMEFIAVSISGIGNSAGEGVVLGTAADVAADAEPDPF